VMLNIGGIRFETYSSTLKLIPESRLANLTETNSDYDPIKNEYFFDRDPGSFLAILNFYRTGSLHAPMDLCGNLFYQELNFWGIPETSIQPCCWTHYSQKRDADEVLKKVMESINYENEPEDDLVEPFDDRVPTFSNFTHKDGVVRIRRENRKNWLFRFLSIIYKRHRPAVWRFYDDHNSSIAATVSKNIIFVSLSLSNILIFYNQIHRSSFGCP
jgi:hypothetical protein